MKKLFIIISLLLLVSACSEYEVNSRSKENKEAMEDYDVHVMIVGVMYKQAFDDFRETYDEIIEDTSLRYDESYRGKTAIQLNELNKYAKQMVSDSPPLRREELHYYTEQLRDHTRDFTVSYARSMDTEVDSEIIELRREATDHMRDLVSVLKKISARLE